MECVVLCAVLFLLLHSAQGKTVEEEGVIGAMCNMGGGVQGRCQEVRACLKEGGVVERAGEVHLCSKHPSDTIVCCRKPHVVAEELCEAWAQYWRDPGGHCVQETSLISGGVYAAPGQYPHIAVLRQRLDNNFIWECGGSLLSPHFVLTAAHCVNDKAELEYWVTLGQHDWYTDRGHEMLPVETGPIPSSLLHADHLATLANTQAPLEQLIRVAEVIKYPDYADYGFLKYHDIALLRLSTPVNFTKRILPACLPTDPSQDLIGKELTIAGWGWTNFAVPELSSVLQKVAVPVVSQLECQKRIPDYNGDSIPRGILSYQMCAGAHGRDSCKGDSGGPLIDQKPRNGSLCEHTVEGIVSFGRSCSDLVVYTRVSSYLDWITGYVAPGYPSGLVGK